MRFDRYRPVWFTLDRPATDPLEPLQPKFDPQMGPGPLHSSRRDDSIGMGVEMGSEIAPIAPMCGYLVEIFANCPARPRLYTESGFLLESSAPHLAAAQQRIKYHVYQYRRVVTPYTLVREVRTPCLTNSKFRGVESFPLVRTCFRPARALNIYLTYMTLD